MKLTAVLRWFATATLMREIGRRYTEARLAMPIDAAVNDYRRLMAPNGKIVVRGRTICSVAFQARTYNCAFRREIWSADQYAFHGIDNQIMLATDGDDTQTRPLGFCVATLLQNDWLLDFSHPYHGVKSLHNPCGEELPAAASAREVP